jgi:uncharacterized protein (TIGR00255 family)
VALSGMTGFARTEAVLGDWAWSVEARSVNGRNLDLRFRAPTGFEALERVAREGAQTRFKRGQLTLGLQARRSGEGGPVRLNLEQLERYLQAGAAYVEQGRATPPSLDGLLGLRGVVEQVEDEDEDARAALESAMSVSIALALDGLAAARGEEGGALAPVLSGLIDQVETLVREAETRAAAQTDHVRQRFEKRLAELIADTGELQERIVQEAAVLAAKADVREELDRLTTHVAAARSLLGAGDAVGRRLDFLTQEFMREANTLCSKSATSELTAVGLELKAVIDQFREQVQNVE